MFKKTRKVIMALFALALITIITPAQSAQAVVDLTLSTSPSSGEVGDTITISGSGTFLGTGGTFRIYFSDQLIELGETDKYAEDHLTSYCFFPMTETIINNSFTLAITIPSSLNTGLITRDGTYYFYLAKFNGMIQKYAIVQAVPFKITGFSVVTLTPTQGNVSDELAIEGEGFWPGENLQILFAGIDITQDYIDGEPKAASSGAAAGTFNVVMIVPVTSQGEKEVKVIGKNSGVEVTRTFTVRPKITLSPAEGGADTQIIVRGTGFSQPVNIFFGNALVKSNAPVTIGTFTEIITIPAGTAPGTYVIKAEDGVRPTTINASASFEVKLYLDPLIELDPQGETVGSVIDIEGTEFENSKSITLTINDQPVTPDSPITSTSTGTFSGSFTIPELPAGTYTLKASSSTNITANATFTVTHEAAIGKTSGKIGDAVAVTGTGFKANTNVSVTFDGTAVNPDGAKTDANGSFSFSITVPVVAEGTHNVVISVGTASVTKTFTTDMNMTIAPESGNAGTEVTITASGFAPSSNADIYFGATKVKTATTTAEGGLNTTITIPAAAEGTHTIRVEVSGISATKDFTLSAEATFSPVTGPVGSSITITGNGFTPNAPIIFKWDGKIVSGLSSMVTNEQGSFSYELNGAVPVAAAGPYEISITVGTITKTQTFTVEASTPPVPQPVSPQLYSTLKDNVTFDWNPVTYDIMDVTYELQLARDASFTTPVISKTGLTATEYTLTAAEKLEKAGEDNPYFWRVRSVDEAGNESAWTSAAEFYYGSGWPSWLTWVLIGLGVVVLGILAFWIGRRIAYYSY